VDDGERRKNYLGHTGAASALVERTFHSLDSRNGKV